MLLAACLLAGGCGRVASGPARSATGRPHVVVTTAGIAVAGVEIVALVCAVADGRPCAADDAAAIAACEGLQECDGTTLDVPEEAQDQRSGYELPALRAAAAARAGDGRILSVTFHPALPYRVMAATIYTLALAGHEDFDVVGLDPRWFRAGVLRYRPPRRDAKAPSAGPAVTVTLSHHGVLELSTGQPGAAGTTLYPNDYGVDLAGLQRWLAALPPTLTAPNVDLVIAAASDIRWGTLARVVAVTRERLPDRGYAYLGALEAALAKQVTDDARRPLFRRLVFAVAPD